MPPCRVEVEILPTSGPAQSQTLYYPSTCVKDFLHLQNYALAEFYQYALAALQEANRRVKEKWGFSCSGCEYLEYKLSEILTAKLNLTGKARVVYIGE